MESQFLVLTSLKCFENILVGCHYYTIEKTDRITCGLKNTGLYAGCISTENLHHFYVDVPDEVDMNEQKWDLEVGCSNILDYFHDHFV